MVSKRLIRNLKSCPATSGLIDYVKKIEKLETDGEGSVIYDDTILVNRINELDGKINTILEDLRLFFVGNSDNNN